MPYQSYLFERWPLGLARGPIYKGALLTTSRESFRIRQAYVVFYSLLYLPQLVEEPEVLHEAYRFLTRNNHSLPPTGSELCRPPNPTLNQPWKVSLPYVGWIVDGTQAPWILKHHAQLDHHPFFIEPVWRVRLNPLPSLPPKSYANTSLRLHLYPYGVGVVSLCSSFTFPSAENGIDCDRFIDLLHDISPRDKKGRAKPAVFQVKPARHPDPLDVDHEGLVNLVAQYLRDYLFVDRDEGAVIWGEEQLPGSSGGMVDLVETEPLLDRDLHAHAFRGVVTMRRNWPSSREDRVRKYREAAPFSELEGAWHYAGGFNTVLYAPPTPYRRTRGRRGRRRFAWEILSVAQFVRAQTTLFRYFQHNVDQELRRLEHTASSWREQGKPRNWFDGFDLPPVWTALWRQLAEVPRGLVDQMDRERYKAHAMAMRTEETGNEFRKTLESYREVVEGYDPPAERWGRLVKDLVSVLGALAGIAGVLSERT